ncbi:MAG: anhydro-N-acetylmuramic acid kinase, partial [Moraxellaceae bacterium]
VSGFDTGPGNVLMDAWILENLNRPYDANGDWADSGRVNDALLTQLLAHPFFSKQPPKSTGREDFNYRWLKNEISSYSISPNDVQATLLGLTAQSICNEIKRLIIAGGIH